MIDRSLVNNLFLYFRGHPQAGILRIEFVIDQALIPILFIPVFPDIESLPWNPKIPTNFRNIFNPRGVIKNPRFPTYFSISLYFHAFLRLTPQIQSKASTKSEISQFSLSSQMEIRANPNIRYIVRINIPQYIWDLGFILYESLSAKTRLAEVRFWLDFPTSRV